MSPAPDLGGGLQRLRVEEIEVIHPRVRLLFNEPFQIRLQTRRLQFQPADPV